MINTNKFKLKRDSHQWVLSLSREGINPRTKKPTTTWKDSYHATIDQVVRHTANDLAEKSVNIVHLESVMGQFMEELKDILTQAKERSE